MRSLGWPSIILPLLRGICPQIRQMVVFKVGAQIYHLESGWNSIVRGQVDLVSIVIHLFKEFKGSIRPWHQLGLSLGRKLFLPEVYPYKISGLEGHSPLMLIGFSLVGGLRFLNLQLNLLIEVFDLLQSLTSLHTWLLIHRPWNKVQWTQRLNNIDNLEGR